MSEAHTVHSRVMGKKGSPDSSRLTMHIKVYSPFVLYFDDIGYSITGKNATGPFDILPKHHNFMTLLTPCDLVIRSSRGEQKFRISGGLMHVRDDKVIVFLDI